MPPSQARWPIGRKARAPSRSSKVPVMVGAHELARAIDRTIDVALGGEVDDGGGPCLLDDGPHVGPLGDVALDERHALAVDQPVETLEVTGVGQLVEHDEPRLSSRGHGTSGRNATDEAGTAGDNPGVHQGIRRRERPWHYRWFGPVGSRHAAAGHPATWAVDCAAHAGSPGRIGRPHDRFHPAPLSRRRQTRARGCIGRAGAHGSDAGGARRVRLGVFADHPLAEPRGGCWSGRCGWSRSWRWFRREDPFR